MWPVQIRATSRTFKDYADAWSDRQVGTSDLSFRSEGVALLWLPFARYQCRLPVAL